MFYKNFRFILPKSKSLLKALFLILISCFFSLTNAQENIQIGKALGAANYNNGARYDYSDPEQINIKVLIWGYVKYPGQYIIPSIKRCK